MNRIDDTFQRLRARGAAALIPYLTAGDPDLDTTRELMRVVADSGADLLEICAPFSDPTADGPLLQRSLEIGLRSGASLTRILELVADFRRESQVPIILYGYYNPIFHYGPERFAADAQRAGVDGVLVVDLPPEEAEELLVWTRPAGIHFICLLAPTSGPERVRQVLKSAAGFVYYVSVIGVTGVRPMVPEGVAPAVRRLRQATNLPVGVGFGISTPEQAGAVAAFADAAVVGSAIMRLVDSRRGSNDMVAEVGAFIRRLKDGVSNGAPQPTEAAPTVMIKNEYTDVLAWLYGLEAARGMDFKLERVALALQSLGNPHTKFKSVHIAGTNGKGSVAAMLHAMISAAGYRVGLYTSPHLVSFTERIRIGAAEIREPEVVTLVHEIRTAATVRGIDLTFFEFVTVMAFLHFAREGVDLAVIEVGLGGRLDATNVVDPDVAV